MDLLQHEIPELHIDGLTTAKHRVRLVFELDEPLEAQARDDVPGSLVHLPVEQATPLRVLRVLQCVAMVIAHDHHGLCGCFSMLSGDTGPALLRRTHLPELDVDRRLFQREVHLDVLLELYAVFEVEVLSELAWSKGLAD